jgi:anti-sigma regulatory factor (Ser/Thr protein kinase)
VLVLLDGPAGLRAARAEARQVCLEHEVDEERSHAVELVLSELLGNAFRHGRPPVAYATTVEPPDVMVTVADTGQSRPVQRADVGPDAEGGRGLLLVASLSRSWGCDETPSGKRVWARV